MSEIQSEIELRFWNKIFLIKFPSSFRWHNRIQIFLISKLKSLQLPQFTALFTSLDESLFQSGLHDVFLEVMSFKLKSADSNSQHEFVIKQLQNLKKNQLTLIAGIFCSILTGAEGDFMKNPLRHILEWPSWTSYFEFNSTHPIHFNMSKEAKDILEKAFIHLLHRINSICTLDIYITDFFIIQKNSEAFLSLSEKALNSRQETSHTIQEVHAAFSNCAEANAWLQKHLEMLTNICLLFKNIRGLNFNDINKFNSLELLYMKLFDVLELTHGKFQFLNHPDLNMIINSSCFLAISNSAQSFESSYIFRATFEQQLDELKQSDLSQGFLIEIAWKQTIEKLLLLVDSCMNETILLSSVQLDFESNVTYELILDELKKLTFGCQKASSKPIEEIPKILECSYKIALYFKFQNCAQSAVKLMKVKQEFSINTDFSLIEGLQNFRINFQNKPLSSINEEVCFTASVLQNITEEDRSFLDTILKNIKFINWVKQNMKNLNDLKTFVEIALTSSSGDQSETDRIMILHSVCTNLAPLIFKVDSQTTCNYLIERCREVFSIVRTNKELIGLLGYVSENILYWEELKKSQGSLEEGALIQLEKIVSSGVCTVSTAKSSIPDLMISLTVGSDGEVTKAYNLEQLKDLRSKLMLIVGKSKIISKCDSHSNAVTFNNFFDLVLEIANIFSALVEIGNMQYLNYSISFTFREIDKIEKEIKKTRKVLEEDIIQLEEAREQNYFLNYYTNAQLVLLQKGLRAYISGDDVNLGDRDQLYHLLGLLNSGVCAEDIHSALQNEELINDKHQISHIHPNPIISLANPSHFSCLGKPSSAFHRAVKPKHSAICVNEELEFPDYFSDSDKTIANNVSSDCGFPLNVAIEGVKSILNNTGVLSEDALIRFCMDYATDTESEGEECNDSDSDELQIDKNEGDYLSDITAPRDMLSIPPESIRSEVEYLDNFKLGKFLREIYHNSETKIRGERAFPSIFKKREPNLIFVPMDLLYESVISLYAMSPNLPLPYFSEVLLCSYPTTSDEMDIFWRRVIYKSAQNHFYVHCLVGIENLEYEVAVQSVHKLRQYLQCENISDFKLVVICSEEREEESYMAAALENYKRPNHISDLKISDSNTQYLWKKLRSNMCSNDIHPTWMVDKDRSRVRLVVSESVGAGKSLYVSNLVSDMLSQGVVREEEREEAAVTVAIHGKQASEEMLTGQLLDKHVSSADHGHLFHVDIASTVQLGLEPILFKLLVLGGICKRTGELWHCRRNDYYIIECTVNQDSLHFLNFTQLFPTIQCIQPIQALNTMGVKNPRLQTFDSKELSREEFQRTFAYLKQMEMGSDLDLYSFNPDTVVCRSPQEMLQLFLKHCGVKQPSWTEIRNFATFLNTQLSDCDNSDYCLSAAIGEEWKGFKSFVIKFLIHMSRDFATPSLESKFGQISNDILKVYEIIERRKWEKSSHPYIFFNLDRHSMTFLGFQISTQGHLLDSDNPNCVIEESIIQKRLLNTLTRNGVDTSKKFLQLEKHEKIEKIAKVMGLEWLADPDPGYVLTLDNVRKILAILMRFRCNIPVVIMGETGCGKTRLIQFMCALQALQTGAKNILILKVHGGTTEKNVMDKVMEAEALAVENSQIIKDDPNSLNIDTVLFFDEANTSPAIGLIKEIMCDRRMYGRKIRTDIGLQFIAACNPYRKHSAEMLNKLSSAGLGFFTEASRTTDRLGDIPLRELVYRVMELPASMRPLVWDFGQLSNDIERTYTREIVAKHLRDRSSPIDANDGVVDVITEILARAQNFMRGRKDECSFVSLRDVERAMTVMLWFYSNLQFFKPESTEDSSDMSGEANESINSTTSDHSILSTLSIPHLLTSPPQTMKKIPIIPPRVSMNPMSPVKKTDDLLRSPPRRQLIQKNVACSPPKPPRLQPTIHNIDYVSYSLILSLAVCYRARLQKRNLFDGTISKYFRQPLTPIRDPNLIHFEVDRCQQLILDQMTVDEHIAKNKALKENVFMMFICIELKIPLFVIGKPGSSKSLAKSIISNNMQGNKCPDKSLLRNFKQVHIMSYQCSQLSTPEGIIGVFRNCRNMQRQTGSKKFVSCVVLDEVGLAEDSPLLPLKVLHPLLEDSNYGTEEIDHDASDEANCLANNPQVCLKVKKSDLEEKEEHDRDESIDRVAFIGISNWSLDPAKMNRGIMVARGDPDIEELRSSAEEICCSDSIRPDIIKSIKCWIPNLAKAYIELVRDYSCPAKSLWKNNTGTREYYGLRDFYSLMKMLVFICNEFGTVMTKCILKHCILRNFGGASDNKALAIFEKEIDIPDSDVGPDCSPLGLIRANLDSFSISFHGETRYLLLLTENYAALNILISHKMWLNDYRVIFGSHFPRDQEYSTICRNINKIKICMESGKAIILLNLENLYESLYDALNQYYMKIYNQRYVDLGLGTHRMKCRVHRDFKLIVIADTETVYRTFPTPLINRLEKHFLTMSTVLSDEGRVISGLLRKWAKDSSTLDRTHSIGFQKRCEFSEGDCFIGYHADTASSIVFHVMKAMYPDEATGDVEVDREVLERSQIQLLRMATTDAVLRVKNSYLRKQSQNIMREYFKLQLGSLEEYLRQALDSIYDNARKHLTLATTHSRLLTDRDVNQLEKRLNEEINEIKCLSLQQFQSEQQFSSEIQKFLRAETGSERTIRPGKRILLVQCDKGTENAKLIACARHKTVEELSDWREESENGECGVCLVFLVQLRREAHGSSFESFCGGEWNTVHIDDIRSLDYEELPPISEIIEKEIHQIFGGYKNQVILC